VSVPELKRAVCPGCGVDLYLHRVDDYWACPECKWNDKPPPPKAANTRPQNQPKIDAAQLTLLVSAQYTVGQLASHFGVGRSTVKRRMRAVGLRSMNPPGLPPNPVCRRGLHPLEGLNVYLDARGSRKCRACQIDYQRERRERLRAEATA
jgi:AraC-like DNA-binding protein